MRLQAVVFDCDGVLADTELAGYLGWKRIFDAHGAELEMDEWIKCVGQPPEVWSPFLHLDRLTGGADPRRVEEMLAAEHDRMFRELEPRPGVADLLHELDAAGVRVGIASNSLLAWVEQVLEAARLPQLFGAIVTRDQVTKPKPAPDPYLEACRRLGADPAESWAVEDSAPGLAAARAAGLRTVAVPGPITAGQDFSSAELRLDDLSRLSLDLLRDRMGQ